MPAPPLHPPPTTPEGTCWSNESFLVQGKVMCIINCSGACQVAILTHIHDDGYIPCTHATRSTRDLQPSVRAPDTRTAPTSAYLSNYRYRAHRTYPGDPAGRQSGASITDYAIPERWRKIGIGNEVSKGR